MNLKDQARIWIKTVVGNHLGRNIRTFKFVTYTGETSHNQLGGVSYLLPAEGKVVEQGEDFTLIKTGPSSFTIVVSKLLSEPVALEDKVAVSFYKLRRFDGTAADGSEDSSVDGCRTVMITGVETRFPANWEGRYLGINERFGASYTAIQNPYLRDMITQMEREKVDGGLRCTVNILVDAGATNLSFTDPVEEESVTTPPGMAVQIANSKFTGSVFVGYDRGADTYFIDLTAGEGGDSRRIDDVHFNELGERLIEAIDDREWLKAKVVITKKAPKKKAQPQPELV